MKNIITSNQSKLVVAAIIASQFMPMAALAGPVRIGGQQAFNITTGGGGLTATARTTSIQKNIDNALVAATNRSPASVGMVYVKGLPVITLGGFYVTTVDTATAKAAKTTPALLAQKWVAGLKTSLKDKASVDNYVAQLTGGSSGAPVASAGTTSTNAGSYPFYQQGRIVYIPAGMTIPVALTSNLSSSNSQVGDRVEARIAQTVQLGDTSIPEGSIVYGKVTQAAAGKRMGKSGTLGLKFDSLRTPNGQEVPITAHIQGGIGKYHDLGVGTDIVKGESGSTKVKKALVHGAVGAGSGALVGTAIGAIAGHGRGAGRGAIAGTAIGGALGIAESLLLRKGEDVKVESGLTLNLILDAPASLAVSSGQM